MVKIKKNQDNGMNLKFFQTKLDKEKSKILKELSRYAKVRQVGIKTEFSPRYVEIGHSKDEEAQETGIYEQNLAIEEHLRARLDKIGSALKKISKGANGKFGVCENCNKTIELRRLKSFPEVRHCSKCHKDGLVD